MQAFYVVIGSTESVESGFPHASHDLHVDDYIGTISDFHANLTGGRIGRPHDVGHHIQSAVFHRPGEKSTNLLFGFRRRHPVVVGTGIFLFASADEGEVFSAGDVTGVTAMVITAWILFLV